MFRKTRCTISGMGGHYSLVVEVNTIVIKKREGEMCGEGRELRNTKKVGHGAQDLTRS